MASTPDFASTHFAREIATAIGHRSAAVEVVGHAPRLYSNVWILAVHTRDGTHRIVAKLPKSRGSFESARAMFELALKRYQNDAKVCIPYVGSVDRDNLILARFVEDPSISALCTVHLEALLRPFGFRADDHAIEEAVRSAGAWLRDWHDRTRRQGLLGDWFQRMVDGEATSMAPLPPGVQRKLGMLPSTLHRGAVCVPHGDFTPANMLWSAPRLTVLDFSSSPNKYVSPAWDRVCMEIGLQCALHFSVRHRGTWRPRLAARVLAAFRDGYGRDDVDSQTERACRILRHLVLYGADLSSGWAFRRRAAWHRRQLRLMLEVFGE